MIIVKIIRQDWGIDIPRNQWVEVLLILREYGWAPANEDLFYLTNSNVSEQDANGIFEAGRKIQDKALKKPIEFYPTPVDMGILVEFTEFCQNGSFSIRIKE